MTSHASHQPTAPAKPARDPRSALIVAAVVAAVLLLQAVLQLLWLVVPGPSTPTDAGSALRGLVWDLPNLLAFAAGVFLLLWLVPVARADRLPIVLMKGLLATAVGVGVALVIGAIFALLLLPGRGFGAFLSSISGFLGATLDRAPLVMLVVLALWVITRERRA